MASLSRLGSKVTTVCPQLDDVTNEDESQQHFDLFLADESLNVLTSLDMKENLFKYFNSHCSNKCLLVVLKEKGAGVSMSTTLHCELTPGLCSKMEDCGSTPGLCSKMEDCGSTPGLCSKMEDCGSTPGLCSKMEDCGSTPGLEDGEQYLWSVNAEEKAGEEEAIEPLTLSFVVNPQGMTVATDLEHDRNDNCKCSKAAPGDCSTAAPGDCSTAANKQITDPPSKACRHLS